MSELNQEYWQSRYLAGDTPWDAGSITTPIKDFIDQITDRQTRILIPGAGRAHEAIYLHKQGFKNVYVCDWSSDAFNLLLEKVPDFPKDHLLIADFFDISLKVDLILEQTFFCALPREKREAYVAKTAELLQYKGKIVGVLFAQEFPFEGPPFGGSAEEYETLFSPAFEIDRLKPCANSIKPRAGKELFIELIKK